MRRGRSKPALIVLMSVLLAGLATAALAFLPSVVRSETVETLPSGTTVTDRNRSTLLDEDGRRVGLLLMVPVLISALPLALIKTQYWNSSLALAAGLLMGFVLIGIASVGLFYLPSALLSSAAAAVTALPRGRCQVREEEECPRS
jgi:hypothetical protein